MAKQKVLYVCEVCDTVFRNIQDARKCEATHLGITYDEYVEYIKLREYVKAASSEALYHGCEESRKVFNEAVEKSLQYEKDHNMNWEILKNIQFE